MRVDAALVALAATLAVCIALRFYVEYSTLYSGSYDCYAKAQAVAELAARNLTGGAPIDPPPGWEIVLLFRNGTRTRFGSPAVKSRCYAYRYASISGELVLVLTHG